MKCIFLCAGYATRLYPLTLDQPKALLPIKGKPILTYLVEKLSDLPEIDEIFVVTNDKFYSHFCSWKNSLNDRRIKIINDLTLTNETRLGGIGDLNLVLERENISDDLLVILGDNFFDFSLRKFVDFFNKHRNSLILLYDLLGKGDPREFGIIEIDSSNKIVSFEEKPCKPKSNFISTGIYFYSKNELAKIRDYMLTNLSKEGPGFLIPYFMKTQSVYGLVSEGNWYDVGSKEIYDKLNFT